MNSHHAAAHSTEHAEKSAHSCCHAHESQQSKQPLPPGGEASGMYICPMHPEVRQATPGSCPICGMALEPEFVSLDQAENPELKLLKQRSVLAVIATTPVFLLEMGAHIFGHLSFITPSWSNSLQFSLSSFVVFWCGWIFLERAWASVLTRNFNMFTLIALGTLSAWAYSVTALAFPEMFPESARGEGGQIGLYFEAAAVISTLVLLGQFLELLARQKTGDAIRALLKLAPETARRVRHAGIEEEVSISEIVLGDILRLKPGERVPVDGEVLEGETFVDESMLSGESVPVRKEPGGKVFAGTLNQSGSVTLKVKQLGAQTMLARIVQMVSQAQRSRAPIQRLADTVSGWFVPAVVVIALIAFSLWYMVGPEPALGNALVAAISVLIIACPCALGLATPMSVLIGVGLGAKHGILVKDAEALEVFERIDTLLIDKTGTLTEGKPRVSKIIPQGDFSEKEILRKVASLESLSEHPLAQAIVALALERELSLLPVAEFKAHRGKGISGDVAGDRLLVGTEQFLLEEGIEFKPEPELGFGSLAHVGISGVYAGVLIIEDQLKEGTRAAVQALQASGIEVIVVSGDREAVVQSVAQVLGIKRFYSQTLPEEKGKIVADLINAGKRVAMAGDGINDAPALARAHVGIAMGTGTDVAIESAGITLLKGDLRALVKARRLSEETMRNIRQNLFFAFVYNAAGVPLAAGILYPYWGILLTPIVAAAAMSLSSVSVIGNALRLSRKDLVAK